MSSGKFRILLIAFIYFYLVCSSILLIYFHKNDVNFINNWKIFYAWGINFSFALILSLTQVPNKYYAKFLTIINKDKYIIVFVLLFAVISRFFFLDTYPYISFGDELRDPGYNALKISQGIIKDLFGFGSYQGYGNFIPLISYFFMYLLDTSILIYRIPAAFIGVLAVLFTYVLTRIWSNRLVAFSAALFLAASVKHIHYSRTELLIVIDSILALFILYAAYLTIKSWKGFFILGISIGLIFHFYAGTRSIATITITYFFIFYLARIVKSILYEKSQVLVHIKETLLGLLLLSAGFVIALGPTFNNLNPNNSFSRVGTTSPIIYDPVFLEKDIFEKINFVASSYKTAFLVYTFEPSEDFHLQYYQPMLAFPVNIFFIFGLLCLLLKFKGKLAFSFLLLVIIMLNPFLNQVLINLVRHDHRLIGITPILSIVAAYGFTTIVTRIIKSTRIRMVIVISIVGIFYFHQLFFYFMQRPSDYSFKTVDYMFYYIAQYIKTDTNYNKYYILNNPEFDFSPLHFNESFEFLDYPKTVEIVDNTTFFALYQRKDSKMGFISTQNTVDLNPYLKTSIIHECKGNTLIPNYSCPLNFEGKYSFYILDNN
ncbi:MAG: hypothetical protein AAB531_03110 [Patescibacteria group bacterium]